MTRNSGESTTDQGGSAPLDRAEGEREPAGTGGNVEGEGGAPSPGRREDGETSAGAPCAIDVDSVRDRAS